eukprot:Nitzschia sp. Nitz4//scaffold266_size26515//21549//23538//NITZ4_008261-RA/size26515-augustus-gene-0.34-mRNA-1//-1//CDS//3329544880//8500//frame0
MSAQEPVVEEVPPPQEIFHLELHAWLEAQQASHGVRHDDFAQYHSYCTRRLARLSHHPAAKKYLVCSPKFATVKAESAAAKPHRNSYCSRLPDTLNATTAAGTTTHSTWVPHVNILWYLVVLAERSWAQAHELQKQQKRRQQVLAKLKRAKNWAALLYTKAQHCCDAESILECEAYASWMHANYALEKLDYQTAGTEYAKYMSLCYQLCHHEESVSKEQEEDNAQQLERHDLFVSRADTVVRPLFRFCQYELKQSGQPLVEEPRLSKATTTAASSNEADSVDKESAIVFRGKELVLDSKELRVQMLKYQSMQQELRERHADSADTDTPMTSEDETSFINLLSVLDDALEVIQTLIGTLEQSQVMGPAVQAKLQQYQLWKGYLQSQKTHLVMEHTSQLLREIQGHAERVHVYVALIQHAQSLLELPRPAGEEEEDEFALQAQANVLRLRACKTYHMAWYYYQKPKNYKAAFALLEQAISLTKRALEEIAACDEDMPHAEEYMKELEELPLASLKAVILAAWHGQEAKKRGVIGDQSTSGNRRCDTNRPLLLRLQDDDAGSTLAGAVEPIPMPCKPVFYDLAYDMALDTTNSLDVIEDFVKENTVQPEPEPSTASKGVFGWLTGSA